jgi:hypothetical protein
LKRTRQAAPRSRAPRAKDEEKAAITASGGPIADYFLTASRFSFELDERIQILREPANEYQATAAGRGRLGDAPQLRDGTERPLHGCSDGTEQGETLVTGEPAPEKDKAGDTDLLPELAEPGGEDQASHC